MLFRCSCRLAVHPPAQSMAELSQRASDTLKRGLAPQACWKPGTDGVSIPGRATIKGTMANVARSVAFEKWRHECPEPVGWHMSKLGMSTCKAQLTTEESADAAQLAALKGMNYFEIPAHHTHGAKAVGKALMDIAELFDIPREGMIIALRVGVMHEDKDAERKSSLESQNVDVVKRRVQASLDRVRAGSFPGMMLNAGLRYSLMTTEQLKALNLRRITQTTVSALTPKWVEAAIAQSGQHISFETIDLVLLDSIETFWDGRPAAEIEAEVTELFAAMERYADNGMIQYYGVYSDNLVSPVTRVFPELPADHMVPDEFLAPKTQRETIDLGMLLRVAAKVSKDGKSHHLRFVSIPMNMTEHTAVSVPYTHCPSETFVSFARKNGVTVLSHRPLESRDLLNKAQRYHTFPMVRDLPDARKKFGLLLEQVLKLEMEAKPFLERLSTKQGGLPLQDIFHGSVFIVNQRLINNLYTLQNSLDSTLIPAFQSALRTLRQSGVKELKDWTTVFETAVNDMWTARKTLLNNRHGIKAILIEDATGRVVPRFLHCPILSQRAINFAASTVDVVTCGMSTSRYVHEAIVLNPAKGGEFVLTPEEITALCNSEDVTYANHNAPHPYMLEPPTGAGGEISGQKPRSMEHMVPIDPMDPKYPDDPKNFDMKFRALEEHKTEAPKRNFEENMERPKPTPKSTS